jgi:methyltransferase (TIGR00027 family)
MKKNQISMTAQGMAAIRALEGKKPSDMRICDDPFAKLFLDPWIFWFQRILIRYAERHAPGFVGFVASRCRYMDDTLDKCLYSGIEQVVILGAGLDSRAYRFEMIKWAVNVFEVDQPATQAAKIARVKKIFHEIPKYVHYVPIDFNEETLDKLMDRGYSRSLKTLFIWEGVTYYLQPEAVDTTLAWVHSNSASGSSILFDTIAASALSSKHLRNEVRLSEFTKRITGEAIIFGIEREQVADFMTQRGFTSVTKLYAEDFKRLYFTGINQSRPVADICSIVQASVP